MPDQFAQSTGPISIDLNGIWQALIDHLGAIGTAIWAGISSNLPMIGTTIWNALANALFGAIRTLLLAIWGAALFDIPHAMTDQFPPVAALLAAGPLIAGAGLVLALSLLAFRTWLRGLAGHGGILDELLGRMTDRRIRHLPVCREGRLVGIISIGDLVKSKIAETEAEAENLKAYISAG